MPAQVIGQTPSLHTYLTSLKKSPPVESSIALLISLLKRRQIKNSRPCAIATAHLLHRVIETERSEDATAEELISRVREVGRRLVGGQPRELAVGNVVRRVLGFVREAAERMGSAEEDGDVSASTTITSATTTYAGAGPAASSLFSFLEHPLGASPAGTPPPGLQTPKPQQQTTDKTDETLDLRAEVESALTDFLQELSDVDAQIAEYALDHIHAGETILTHGSSHTVQRFLAAAAKKRKFTLIHAEAYPNDSERTHVTIVTGGEDGEGEKWKPLAAMGITVILIPDTAVFALMSRVDKVLLSPHAVLANGALVTAAGASTIALAANTHRVPVVVLAGLYKLCPLYPFDTQELIEYGDPGKVVGFEEGEFMDKVDVVNPVFDVVEAGGTDLFVTNVGVVGPGFLYRFVGDHYWSEDVEI